mmetsp:Transcript_51986/g.144024  ORF Transcript_51986/g.144024 Transcript_51986/m.144024 type:complete len:227 (-) Transcript_51986:1201-1881(-)
MAASAQRQSPRSVLPAWFAPTRGLVVEEAEAGESHRHAVLVGRRDHLRIGDAAARRHEVLDALLRRHIDRIAEGEEGIRGERHAIEGLEERGLLLGCERLGLGLKLLQPLGVLDGSHVTLDIAHARIDPLLPLDARFERQRAHLGVLAEVPRLHLAAGKLDAIDARLLAGAHANHLAVLREADRIGLRVLDGDLREQEVALRRVGQLLLGGHDVGERRATDRLGRA